jgi:hypothetical protein
MLAAARATSNMRNRESLRSQLAFLLSLQMLDSTDGVLF